MASLKNFEINKVSQSLRVEWTKYLKAM